MNKYTKLKVYPKIVDIIVKLYKFTERLPESEKFGLIVQIRRAAVSIILNLAEGSGSGSDLEYQRFIRISLRSVYEIKTALEICYKLNFCSRKEAIELWKNLDEIGAMLSDLIKSLNRNQ